MRVVILLLLCIVALSAAKPNCKEWNQFKTKYGKKYGSSRDEKYRKSVFEKNLEFIKKHNGKSWRSYTLKMNEFGDMTNEEINRSIGGHVDRLASKESCSKLPAKNKTMRVRRSVNWVKKGAVTPVVNQGRCKASWAFAAAGQLESQIFIERRSLRRLSAQQLIDCSKNHKNYGCRGGNPRNAFSYIYDGNGINYEKYYPYKGKDGECRYNPDSYAVAAYITTLISTRPSNEDELKELVNIGPRIATIDFTLSTSHFYGHGVYDDIMCSSDHETQSVLVVGYGEEDGKEFWLLKNSLGTDWGDEGYMKLVRDNGNQCGIANIKIEIKLKNS